MTQLTDVLILAGGLSHERAVSLRSGRRVADALTAVGVPVNVRDADAALLSVLAEQPPAAVFPCLHGALGEDGALREVLELLDLPYVGSRPDACRLAWAKPVAKAAVRAAGLATPPAVALPRETFRELGATAVLDALVQRLGLPVFVKPTQGGSALGSSVVQEREQLPAAMVGCFAYGDTALVERFVDGTEVAVSVVDSGTGPLALPAVEVAPDSGMYDYASRYTAGTTEFFVPARLPDEVLDDIAAAALTAHRTLGLRDLSRTDFVVDHTGTPWFLEVNVAPGMTQTSLFPQAIAAAGLELGEVCRELLTVAVERHVRRGTAG